MSRAVSFSSVTDEQITKWEQQSREIFLLSEQASKSKKNLLALIEYFHDPSEDEYREANFLIQTLRDVEKWVDIWRNGVEDEDENVENIFQVNRLFRNWKVSNDIGEFEEFKELLFLDKQDWVETYFEQTYCERTKYELERILNEMSVEQIWKAHKEFPFARIEYLTQLKEVIKNGHN